MSAANARRRKLAGKKNTRLSHTPLSSPHPRADLTHAVQAHLLPTDSPDEAISIFSCARLCHVAGGELEQIQFLLGHGSVQTTERYLGSKQKIRDAVNDRIGIEPAE